MHFSGGRRKSFRSRLKVKRFRGVMKGWASWPDTMIRTRMHSKKGPVTGGEGDATRRITMFMRMTRPYPVSSEAELVGQTVLPNIDRSAGLVPAVLWNVCLNFRNHWSGCLPASQSTAKRHHRSGY